MNKKTKQTLVAGLAATMGAGIVAPVVQAAPSNLDAQYKQAFDATVKAQQTKDQKDITAARGLVDAFYQAVKNDKVLINNARTMSAWLDAEQQVKFNYIIDLCVNGKVEKNQKNINTARYIFVNMPQSWKVQFNAYSTAIDGIQQGLINNAVAAVKKAEDSKLQADVDAAMKLVVELKTAENNASVVNEAVRLEGLLNAIVVKLEVNGVSISNSTSLTMTGAGLNQLKIDDITIFGATAKTINVSTDKKSATIELDGRLEPNRELVVKVKVGEETKEFKLTYGFVASNVSLNEKTYDDDRAGQKLTFNINGQSTDADAEYLNVAGYSVNFVATDKDGKVADIFEGATNVSSTGKLKTGIEVGEYNIQVQLSKAGVSTVSTTGKIQVANIDGEVSSIDRVLFAKGAKADVLYNDKVQGEALIMNSTTLVAGETANVYHVRSIVNGVKVTSPADSFKVESSNSAVISVNSTTGELTANSKGTATITVKVGKQTRTFTFTVTNEARKVNAIKTNVSSVKTVVNGKVKVEFTTEDQYGDPFKVETGNPDLNDKDDARQITEVIAKDANGNELINTPFEIVTGTPDSIGVEEIELTALKVGRGTIYFKNYEGKVIGSLYVDITDNGSIASSKLEIVETTGFSSDNTLELSNSKDNKVKFAYKQYNPNQVFIANATLVTGTGTPANSSEYKIEALDTTIAKITGIASDNVVTIESVKEGSTDIVVKNDKGVIVATTRIAVTNTPYKITGVSFKTIPTVDYVGKQVYAKDILDLVDSNLDDIVNGITLSKTSSSKTRIVKETSYTIKGSSVNSAYPVNTIYLDLNDNGVSDSTDIKLGTLVAEKASDANFNVNAYTPGSYVKNGFLSAVSAKDNKGTVLIKVMTDPTDVKTSITGTSFYVNVK